ncbi:hypothetical protein LEP1GSC021_0070 [Leptospira noguchii str. 1993005606]|nr:hypothetical protein LEP1GSC021_2568 [Leptospira noguchii str. 1993005606]EPE85659.1 hypothetical protein LEP1GSC021_0070 [Leptospira noguchii str. 1993005606]
MPNALCVIASFLSNTRWENVPEFRSLILHSQSMRQQKNPFS